MLAAVHISIWTAIKHDRRVSREGCRAARSLSRRRPLQQTAAPEAERLESLRSLSGQIRQYFYRSHCPGQTRATCASAFRALSPAISRLAIADRALGVYRGRQVERMLLDPPAWHWRVFLCQVSEVASTSVILPAASLGTIVSGNPCRKASYGPPVPNPGGFSFTARCRLWTGTRLTSTAY
jgi:hypothetical protein